MHNSDKSNKDSANSPIPEMPDMGNADWIPGNPYLKALQEGISFAEARRLLREEYEAQKAPSDPTRKAS